MLSPFAFCDEIFHMDGGADRRTMAELALNLYFGPEARAFDASRIFGLLAHDRLLCIGALAWASSQPRWEARAYMLNGSDYLDGRLRGNLERAATDLSTLGPSANLA